MCSLLSHLSIHPHLQGSRNQIPGTISDLPPSLSPRAADLILEQFLIQEEDGWWAQNRLSMGAETQRADKGGISHFGGKCVMGPRGGVQKSQEYCRAEPCMVYWDRKDSPQAMPGQGAAAGTEIPFG